MTERAELERQIEHLKREIYVHENKDRWTNDDLQLNVKMTGQLRDLRERLRALE